MRHEDNSKMAIFTAIQRAAHQVLDGEPKILPDPLAAGFAPGSSRKELLRDAKRFRRPDTMRLRSVIVLRSRFVEDELESAVASGVRQYVMLGAGFETFPYRQPAWAAGLRTFEVDHPGSQALKVRHLEQLGVSRPANTVLCPIDFETSSLETGLRQAGFNPGLPTLVSALGLTQYLTSEANEALFGFALGLVRGSRYVFSFVLPEDALPEDERKIHRQGCEKGAARGEPWLSFFTPEALDTLLHDLGFREVRILSPAEAKRRYFAGRDDGLEPPTLEQMAVACV